MDEWEKQDKFWTRVVILTILTTLALCALILTHTL